jgi:hypothetical protein
MAGGAPTNRAQLCQQSGAWRIIAANEEILYLTLSLIAMSIYIIQRWAFVILVLASAILWTCG